MTDDLSAQSRDALQTAGVKVTCSNPGGVGYVRHLTDERVEALQASGRSLLVDTPDVGPDAIELAARAGRGTDVCPVAERTVNGSPGTRGRDRGNQADP